MTVPIKKFSEKPPKSNSVILVSRTDPPPRYFPNGGGRDLFNIAEGSISTSVRGQKQVPCGIMSRKLPETLSRKNKQSPEQKKRKYILQKQYSTDLSSSGAKHSSKSPPRSPKRHPISHFSPLALKVDRSVMKKIMKVDPKWK